MDQETVYNEIIQFLQEEGSTMLMVDALAGCGKTTLLARVRKSLAPNATLTLSFNNTSVRVAREIIGGPAQTFDSLFHRVHQYYTPDGAEAFTGDFEALRQHAQDWTECTLREFECLVDSSNHYAFRDLNLVIIDEAQDTPSEAAHVIEVFKRMGLKVLPTGDRRQSIYRFLRSENLFARYHSDPTVKVLTMNRSFRCDPFITEYVNRRFGAGMVSACPADLVDPFSIVVQSRTNAALARVYARLLFCTKTFCHDPRVAEESRAEFETHVLSTICQMYDVDTDSARRILEDRLDAQTHPTTTTSSTIVYSTVYMYKGDGCDVTILTGDLQADVWTEDETEENIKYVGITRARHGIVDLHRWRFIGSDAWKQKVAEIMAALSTPGTKPISPCHPKIFFRMIGYAIPGTVCPLLSGFIDMCHQKAAHMPTPPYLVDYTRKRVVSAENVLQRWWVERCVRLYSGDVGVYNNDTWKNVLDIEWNLKVAQRDLALDFRLIRVFQKFSAWARIFLLITRACVVLYRVWDIRTSATARRAARLRGLLETAWDSGKVTDILPCIVAWHKKSRRSFWWWLEEQHEDPTVPEVDEDFLATQIRSAQKAGLNGAIPWSETLKMPNMMVVFYDEQGMAHGLLDPSSLHDDPWKDTFFAYVFIHEARRTNRPFASILTLDNKWCLKPIDIPTNYDYVSVSRAIRSVVSSAPSKDTSYSLPYPSSSRSRRHHEVTTEFFKLLENSPS